jgi:hypothetical protein
VDKGLIELGGANPRKWNLHLNQQLCVLKGDCHGKNYVFHSWALIELFPAFGKLHPAFGAMLQTFRQTSGLNPFDPFALI